MKILIPIDARLLVNNVEYKGIGTGLFAQLRLASDETTVKSTGTEIETSGVYEFEITGTALTSYLELWICATENGTYTKVKSWGGTDGIRQKEYLVYTALLTQEGGTVDPTVTVLTNELGFTITWVRETTGTYSYSSMVSGTFPILKTFAMIQQTSITTSDGTQVSIQIDNDTQVEIRTTTIDSGLVDGALYYTSVEIRIYP